MKKLLSILMAGTVVASSASTVVACGSYKSFTDLYLVTDSGKISDKGFNESGKTAGDYFAKEILGIDSSYNGIGYYQSKDINDIKNGYNIAKTAGAKTLILPGFNHGGQNLKAAGETLPEGTSIFIDGNHYRTEFNQEGIIVETNRPVDNVIGLLYRADISGFWAGMSAIIESIIIGNTKENQKVITDIVKPEGNKTVVRMSTFGGMSNFTAVETFMIGYLAAIEVYNQIFNTENYENIKTTLTNEINEKLLKDSDKKYEELSKDVWASRVESQKGAPKNSNDTKWYSGSFDQGKGDIISQLLLPESDVIMPVAGGQTFDVLGVRKSKNYKTKLVGVDTNQALSFSSYGSDIFLTSAEKNIVDSTIVALAHTSEYANNQEVQQKAQAYYKEKNLNMTFDNTGLEQQANTPAGQEVYSRNSEGNITGNNTLDNWNKTTVWTGGQISSGSNNLVSNELKNIVLTTFDQEALMSSSISYFETANKTPKDLLVYVQGYANTLIKNLKK